MGLLLLLGFSVTACARTASEPCWFETYQTDVSCQGKPVPTVPDPTDGPTGRADPF